MSAGAIGQFFASPTDLVKVQMQMEGKRKLEGKPLRSVPLEAGGFFLLMITLWLRVRLSLFSATLSPQLLGALSGEEQCLGGTWWLWAVERVGGPRLLPYSFYTHLSYSDALVPETTNPRPSYTCSMSVPGLCRGEGRMLSEEGKLKEKMGDMARAGCTGAGKGWVACRQQGSRPSCRYQDTLLFASKTAGIVWCLVHLVLQPSCGIKGSSVISDQTAAYQGNRYVWQNMVWKSKMDPKMDQKMDPEGQILAAINCLSYVRTWCSKVLEYAKISP